MFHKSLHNLKWLPGGLVSRMQATPKLRVYVCQILQECKVQAFRKILATVRGLRKYLVAVVRMATCNQYRMAYHSRKDFLLDSAGLLRTKGCKSLARIQRICKGDFSLSDVGPARWCGNLETPCQLCRNMQKVWENEVWMYAKSWKTAAGMWVYVAGFQRERRLAYLSGGESHTSITMESQHGWCNG